MDRLEYLARELNELRKMAAAENAALLAYLIEMAMVEAEEEAKKRRPAPVQ